MHAYVCIHTTHQERAWCCCHGLAAQLLLSLQMHGTCLGLEALANVIAGGKRVLS